MFPSILTVLACSALVSQSPYAKAFSPTFLSSESSVRGSNSLLKHNVFSGNVRIQKINRHIPDFVFETGLFLTTPEIAGTIYKFLEYVWKLQKKRVYSNNIPEY